MKHIQQRINFARKSLLETDMKHIQQRINFARKSLLEEVSKQLSLPPIRGARGC